MAILIGHASSDENGKYSCGKAGDLTGKEVTTREWYKRPWNVVLIHPDKKIRELLAKAMEDACANDHIGYDQDAGSKNDAGRFSLFKEARKVNFDFTKIKNDCETDCSNLVAACCNAAGLAVSEYIYTGNEKSALIKEGFVAYTDKKYTDSPDYLPRGTVLLYEGHHTAILLTNGAKCSTNGNLNPLPAIDKVSGQLKVDGASSLAVRDYPSTDNNISNIKKTVSKGKCITVVGRVKMDSTTWFQTNDKLWVSAKYLIGILTESNGQSWIIELGYTYSTGVLKEYNKKLYCLDSEGWIITPDRLNKDGSLR